MDESLYEWNVKIIKLDPESPLAQDLKELAKKNGQDHILLSMTFKDSFPFSPPFVRIVSPVILGGYIMNGGAICTELVYIIKYSTDKIIIDLLLNFKNDDFGIFADIFYITYYLVATVIFTFYSNLAYQ